MAFVYAVLSREISLDNTIKASAYGTRYAWQKSNAVANQLAFLELVEDFRFFKTEALTYPGKNKKKKWKISDRINSNEYKHILHLIVIKRYSALTRLRD